MHGWRSKTDLGSVISTEFRGEFAIGDFDAIQSFKKINMEEGAAEFAVCDAFQARSFLLFYDLCDAAVFDLPQGCIINFAIRMLLAGIGQFGGPEETADMVGAKRGCAGHDRFFSHKPVCRIVRK